MVWSLSACRGVGGEVAYYGTEMAQKINLFQRNHAEMLQIKWG